MLNVLRLLHQTPTTEQTPNLFFQNIWLDSEFRERLCTPQTHLGQMLACFTFS